MKASPILRGERALAGMPLDGGGGSGLLSRGPGGEPEERRGEPGERSGAAVDVTLDIRAVRSCLSAGPHIRRV